MVNTVGLRLGSRAARLLARLGRSEIRPGLTEQELAGIEARFGFAFADDHRAFLAVGLPTGGGWPDCRCGDAALLRSWLDRPVEDVLFAVAEADFWLPGWGTRPARQTDAVAGARAHLASVPQLVPVYSHRYLPAGRETFAHPVLSIRGADIIAYGYDLIDYVHQKFGDPQDRTEEERQVVDATAAFWGGLPLLVEPGRVVEVLFRPVGVHCGDGRPDHPQAEPRRPGLTLSTGITRWSTQRSDPLLEQRQRGASQRRARIRPGQARSTALFGLATEIPAAILARTLGMYPERHHRRPAASVRGRRGHIRRRSQQTSDPTTSKEKTDVPLDDRHVWDLLRQLDDPNHMEFPGGYHQAAARVRFDQLATRLDQRFQCTCSVDRGVQDASHHGTIVIPDTAAASGERITLTVSNFGNLTAVTLGTPGSYDEEEENILFETADRRRIEDELEALGYTTVSEHLLWTRYNGVSKLRSSIDRTWWDRFFDYL